MLPFPKSRIHVIDKDTKFAFVPFQKEKGFAMAKSAPEEAYNDIANYIGSDGSKWYVGIASIPRARLFVDHKVDEKNGSWIYRNAETEASARAVEDALIKNLGTQGGGGGGDKSTIWVYAYLITSTTIE